MSRQRVYFFNRFFWPDNSATAQILTDLCRGLDKREYAVTVVTSRLNYGDPAVAYPGQEEFQGIEISRLWSTRFGRSTLLGRLLDYATIYLSFFVFTISRLGAEDIAVFKTDPPLLSIPGAVGKTVKGFRMVAWCQDVFPEVATSGIQLPKGAGLIFNVLARIRDWSLQVADAVVVLGKDMTDFLSMRGIPKEKLQEISNWSVQDEEPSINEAALREKWGIPTGTFVVGYSGNLGRAHDWETLLEAARLLKQEKDLLFLCCGGGHGYEQLKIAVEEEQLQELFGFLPYQPLELLGATLRVPDIHWLTLKESLTPFIFPSKFFGILQAGRPLIFIGSTAGEIAGLIRSNKIGHALSEGQGTALAEVIRSAKADQEKSAKAGKLARVLWEEKYQKSLEIEKWKQVLVRLGTPGRGGKND
ncbi:glycosyltransferase family 4 protein [Puniceicoccales bacterium CK1056]|uniref:Glycosyltransferase family 4 protein n=1 Tax=Oceanipulchritudo coccoides TaxID=2706888 RepID=A0A6B2M067_9BACT|nr:glycosyltransferase family 4 protein [Oceanipulchritudo coccoides]NDV62308.1 glycosyltransferase family 4 protein [Oceanipulchritudo coccoides]